MSSGWIALTTLQSVQICWTTKLSEYVLRRPVSWEEGTEVFQLIWDLFSYEINRRPNDTANLKFFDGEVNDWKIEYEDAEFKKDFANSPQALWKLPSGTSTICPNYANLTFRSSEDTLFRWYSTIFLTNTYYLHTGPSQALARQRKR